MQPELLMFHKPKGCTVTRSDELGQATVYDLLPSWVLEEGYVPIGRLDKDSKGLLLFTRIGHWVGDLTRPGAVEKTYEVWVRGWVSKENLRRAVEGIASPVGILRAKSVAVLGGGGPKTRLEVILIEGKNREIRRLFASFQDATTGRANKVLDLKRTKVGPVSLDIPSGHWRFLTEAEENSLRALKKPRKK
jgi:23S rRNA pseudouridine2605 synthase